MDAKQIKDEIKDAIATRKTEREAAHRRSELLHVAAQIAGGMMASPLGANAAMGAIAEAAVKIAELVVDAVDRKLSPIVQLDPTKIAPVASPRAPGGAQ